MTKVRSNKTPLLITLVFLSYLIVNVTSIYACIGQDGRLPPIPTYPADPTKIPIGIDRIGENTLVILVDFDGCAGTMPQDSWNKILLTTNTPGKSILDCRQLSL